MADLEPLLRRCFDRMIAHVIGGLGEYFGIDPTVATVTYVGWLLLTRCRFYRSPSQKAS